jgi:2-phospho-L-lactate guanylyltransferase
VVREAVPEGQNAAASRAIDFALAEGAGSILLLSSDLPLVTRDVIARLLQAGSRLARPAALAAPATGRGGTNALYLSPPDALPLSFGDDSLVKFELAAAQRGVNFALFESPELALDVDEPSDLARLGRAAPG